MSPRGIEITWSGFIRFICFGATWSLFEKMKINYEHKITRIISVEKTRNKSKPTLLLVSLFFSFSDLLFRYQE